MTFANLTTLARFGQGQPPQNPLIIDASGDLFGMNVSLGSIYEYTNGAFITQFPINSNQFNAIGISPIGAPVLDASGNVFGVTRQGGALQGGTMFELHNGIVTPMVNFTQGHTPDSGLTMDANGNLFGETFQGGAASGVGSEFEMIKTGPGPIYGPPAKLFSFGGITGSFPDAALIADANGNLYGTTSQGGVNGAGSVFEILKTGSGYAGAPITLFSFNSVIGYFPSDTLLANANGDLFGTAQGSPSGFGTVFELAKGAAAPIVLTAFNSANGANPEGALIEDAAGNLFGTTAGGGANNLGTVFELVKANGHALQTLLSFNGANGSTPIGGLLLDGNGDLFGTASKGGPGGQGSVFELAKSGAGYNFSTLVGFNGTNGANPAFVSLIADSMGNLFGTTSAGGTGGQGTAFEIICGGYVPFKLTGFTFSPDTANLAALESGGAGLAASIPLGAFRQAGGAPSDTYTYTLAGANGSAFAMTSAANIGTLTSGGGGDLGAAGGKVYALTVQVNSTTTGANTGPLPFDVVVDRAAGDTINTLTLGIAATTPTFIYGLGGGDTINASGLSAAAWVAGGNGADTITGGSGPNTYLYGSTAESRPGSFDIIINFNTSQDKIDLTGLGLTPLAFQAAHLAGGATIAANTIAWQVNGGNTSIYVNTSGAAETKAAANMRIELLGNLTPVASDFSHH